MSDERFKSRKQEHKHGKRTAASSFKRRNHKPLDPADDRKQVKRRLKKAA